MLSPQNWRDTKQTIRHSR